MKVVMSCISAAKNMFRNLCKTKSGTMPLPSPIYYPILSFNRSLFIQPAGGWLGFTRGWARCSGATSSVLGNVRRPSREQDCSTEIFAFIWVGIMCRKWGGKTADNKMRESFAEYKTFLWEPVPGSWCLFKSLQVLRCENLPIIISHRKDSDKTFK